MPEGTAAIIDRFYDAWNSHDAAADEAAAPDPPSGLVRVSIRVLGPPSTIAARISSAIALTGVHDR
jgi:hypothetical protein